MRILWQSQKIVDLSYLTVYRIIKNNIFLNFGGVYLDILGEKIKNIDHNNSWWKILLDSNFNKCIDVKSNLILDKRSPILIFLILKSKKWLTNDILSKDIKNIENIDFEPPFWL